MLKLCLHTSTSPVQAKKNEVEHLSPKSISDIKKSIYSLLWLADCKTLLNNYIITTTYKKISFFCLTLCSPQAHTDIYIKKVLLNQFFNELRVKFPHLLYLWRAEKQQNGNVHFHVLMNHFYKSDILQRQWNRILDKFGYVKIYKEKFSNMRFDEYRKYMETHYNSTYAQIKKGFAKGVANKWSNPPSTQINSLIDVGNISGYISKEMTKQNQLSPEEKNQSKWSFPLAGKNWSCSQEITSKSFISTDIPTSCYSELQSLQSRFKDKEYKNDYITHYSISPDQFLQLKLKNLFDFYHKFITS